MATGMSHPTTVKHGGFWGWCQGWVLGKPCGEADSASPGIAGVEEMQGGCGQQQERKHLLSLAETVQGIRKQV